MKSKVWLVSHGDYSEYTIDGVFDTEEKAKAFASYWDGVKGESEYAPCYEVEEMALNPGIPQIRKGYKLFLVRMGRDGDTLDVYVCNFVGDDVSEIFREDWRGSSHLLTYCWAKDEQHAVKIANERRVQLIAGNLW